MIDLKSAARQARPLTKQIEFPALQTTKTQSDELARVYLQVVRLWRDSAARIVAEYDPPNPNVLRDTQEGIEAEIAATQAAANTVIVSLSVDIDSWINRLARWHTRRWTDTVRTKTGVTIDQFLSSRTVAAELKASLRWNVSLIRNVSDQVRDRIANIVWAGWREGTPRREIAKRINEAIGLGRKRSLLIAIDQTVKLSADLDRARMLEAGIEDWAWKHSGKTHFRPVHKARDGKEYNWITNRPDDVPGQLPYCGCKARAILKLD